MRLNDDIRKNLESAGEKIKAGRKMTEAELASVSGGDYLVFWSCECGAMYNHEAHRPFPAGSAAIPM